MQTRWIGPALLLAVGLWGCAGAPRSAPAPEPKGAAAEPTQLEKTESDLTDALATPLNDLNVMRQEIPPVLLSALDAPYAPLASSTCAAIRQAVQGLDAVLGADLDTPSHKSNPSLIERGTGLASDGVVRTVRGAVDIIPFRSWVRRLSGAEKHQKKVTAAISAGAVRRAYLKGLGQAKGCQAPAAPQAATQKKPA